MSLSKWILCKFYRVTKYKGKQKKTNKQNQNMVSIQLRLLVCFKKWFRFNWINSRTMINLTTMVQISEMSYDLCIINVCAIYQNGLDICINRSMWWKPNREKKRDEFEIRAYSKKNSDIIIQYLICFCQHTRHYLINISIRRWFVFRRRCGITDKVCGFFATYANRIVIVICHHCGLCQYCWNVFFSVVEWCVLCRVLACRTCARALNFQVRVTWSSHSKSCIASSAHNLFYLHRSGYRCCWVFVHHCYPIIS